SDVPGHSRRPEIGREGEGPAALGLDLLRLRRHDRGDIRGSGVLSQHAEPYAENGGCDAMRHMSLQRSQGRPFTSDSSLPAGTVPTAAPGIVASVESTDNDDTGMTPIC